MIINNESLISDSLLLNIDIQEYPFEDEEQNYVIALSGSTFEYFYKLSKKYKETHQPKYKVYSEVFKIILQYSKIFYWNGTRTKSKFDFIFK